MSDRPPLYKELLVGILVGGLLGPLIGWFIGALAAFFAVTAMDTNNVRVMRGSACIGGLLVIPVGFVIGLIVSPVLRLISTQLLSVLKNPALAAISGAFLGWLISYLTVDLLYATLGSVLYVVMVSMVVGATAGMVVVMAKPKWL